MIRIGILGFGTVGQATYDLLQDHQQTLKAAVGQVIQVVRIAVRNRAKYASHPAYSLIGEDSQAVVADEAIDVIIEVTGQVDCIYPLVSQALQAGKHVITANKALMSQHFDALMALAGESRGDLRFEAAVGGAIPIIAALENVAAMNRIDRIEAVVNGTCNFILSQMEAGMDFDRALYQAQALGYAEADPTADIDGWDSLYKLHLLANLSFGQTVPLTSIERQGIQAIHFQTVQEALSQNRRIKLLAQAYRQGDQVIANVGPVAVATASVLGGLNDSENAVRLVTDNAGELVFKGPGAGGRPTATAILSDLLTIYR